MANQVDQRHRVPVAIAPTARVARVARLLRRAFDEELQSLPLTAPQLGLLNRLRTEDGLVQAELGRRMCIEAATLTGMLQRLESAGWVRRDSDERNRRLQRVWLTAQTRAAIPEITRIQERHRARALAGLSAEQLASLEAALMRIEENLIGPSDE
jgi:DNA-binding MarR family transcriptional regulator